jgi:hypothetical protein
MARLNESVHIEDFPLDERDAQVSLLESPWIGDEGPLDAGFRRGLGELPLRPRGLAFDRRTTVVWDEAGVLVLTAAAPRLGVTALQSRVLLRDKLSGPPELLRVDYLERGSLLGSRYIPEGDQGHA